MRVSVFRGDFGFQNYLAHRPITVMLDGEPVDKVVRADDELGWVEVNVVGEDGLFLIEGGEVVSEILHGNVSFSYAGMDSASEDADPSEEEPTDA